MIGTTSVRAVGWLVSPMLASRFPRLNAAAWNAQYKLGVWNPKHFAAGAQILNLVEEFTPNATILDLGCGTSATLPLAPENYRHYHGVDISAAAIERARALGRSDTSFEAADILTYEPAGQYEAILLREVLCYFTANQAAELLRRMAGFLRPGGQLYVQLWQGARSPFTTPSQFLDVVRNCGLVVVAERAMEGSNGSDAVAFLVLGPS